MLEDEEFERGKQEIIIEHVHPLREKVIVLEQRVEHHDKELNKLTTVLHELSYAIQRNTELVKKIWWLMIGGGIAFTGVWAVIKFLHPIITIAG